MDGVIRNRTVLYLSYDGMTDPLGQSQVLPYLRGLSKEGYIIHLVSYEKMDRFKKHKHHIQKICDQASIHWHPQDYVMGRGLRSTLRQILRMRQIAFYLDDKYHFAIVHCRSYIAALAGQALKRKRGTKFIFDMRGFWADERVDGKIWNLQKPLYKAIYRYFKMKEQQFLREADYTISLTENGRKEILSWEAFSHKQPKIKVIPCCVDTVLFDPEKITPSESQQMRVQLGIHPEAIVLGYVGSIGTWYMLEEMLDFFKVLREQKNTAVFLFVSGEDPSNIQKVATSKGISSDQLFVISALHSEVPKYISIFDASIFFIRPSYSKKASSPTKQGEIMAMGIPLICNAGVGDTDQIVANYQSGQVISEFDQENYRKAVLSMDAFDRQESMKGAKEYFSLEEGVARYVAIYHSIHE